MFILMHIMHSCIWFTVKVCKVGYYLRIVHTSTMLFWHGKEESDEIG